MRLYLDKFWKKTNPANVEAKIKRMDKVFLNIESKPKINVEGESPIVLASRRWSDNVYVHF